MNKELFCTFCRNIGSYFAHAAVFILGQKTYHILKREKDKEGVDMRNKTYGGSGMLDIKVRRICEQSQHVVHV